MEKLIGELTPNQRRQMMSFMSYCMEKSDVATRLKDMIINISISKEDFRDHIDKGIGGAGGHPDFCECCKNKLSVLYKQEGAEHNMATIVDGLKTTAGLAGIMYLLVSSVMTYRSYKQNKMPKAR